MALTFSKATKRQAKLRMALIGPSGSGKTYSALAIAGALGGRIALVDTEHGSASKYADLFSFDCLELDSFSPETYTEAITAAEQAGYDVLVIDSLSHAWTGKGGILEFVDRQRAQSGDAFGDGWRKATPKHNALVDAILSAQLHIIATMRSKTEYVVETLPNGKSRIRKVGMQPVQRDGIEFEFDVTGDLDQDNTLTITKSRCPALSSQQIEKPGAQVAAVLRAWLGDGLPASPPPAGASTTTASDQTVAPAHQEKPQQNGHTKPGRPYTPDTLKLALRQAAHAHDKRHETATDDQRSTCASVLQLCWAGDPRSAAMRNHVATWLGDAQSIDEISGVMILALLDWLKPAVDSGGALAPDGMAVREAMAVWNAIADTVQGSAPADDELPAIFDKPAGEAAR